MNPQLISLIFLSLLPLQIASTQFLPKSQFVHVFTQIDAEHFGNALLSTISLQMFADTPADDTVAMLNEVNELLAQEQKDEDEEIYQIREDCNNQLGLLNKSIGFHTSLIESLQYTKSFNENLIKAVDTKLEQISKRLVIVNDMQNQEQQRNAKLVEEYENRIEQLNNATITVNEALSIIEHLKTDASFVQLQKSVKGITTKLTQFKSTNHQIGPLLTILSVLGQITKNGDQEALDEILKLMNRIRENYLSQIAKEKETEERRLTKFDNYITQLNQESTSQTIKQQVGQQEKEEYKEILDDAQKSLSFHGKQLQKQIEANQRTTDFCLTKNEEYEITTKYRAMDRNALEMLIPKFKEKSRALKKYFQSRADNQF